MNNIQKPAEEYLKEPYTRIVVPDEESGTFTVQILEFPGCIAEGSTVQKAYKHLEQVAKSWIEEAIEQGQDIPMPFSVNDFGGKFALRIPKSLHKQAALAAELDGTSLNQFIVMAISERVGALNMYRYLADKSGYPVSQTNVTNAFIPTVVNLKIDVSRATQDSSAIYQPDYLESVDSERPCCFDFGGSRDLP
jgi:predicted HicB family RNase H-like nuclease